VNSVQLVMVSVAVGACIAGLLSANAAIQADPIEGRQGLWSVIRWRVILVVALLFWIGGIVVLAWLIDRSPLEQPISLDPPGAIDTRIWIPLRARYTLLFEFSPQGHSAEQLKKLIGELDTDGVPIALSWTLTSSKTNTVVIRGSAVAKGRGRDSGGTLFRSVDALDVEPGQYQFRATILNPVPQLASLSARLELRHIFEKTGSAWISNALLLGAFTVWIVIPAFLFLVGWVVGRVGFPHLRCWMKGSRAGH
jgi:hypothetical protein